MSATVPPPATASGGGPTPRRHAAVSMADVARLAGVSSQTVSRVSNGHPGVVESTRRQVLAAMKELGYRPNSAARALKLGQFNTIGVILFNLSTTGNSRTVEAIATIAASEGYAITLIPVGAPTQDGVLGAYTRLGELAVDGVIVILEVHLLDAVTVTLPPGVHVVVVDSDAGDRYTVVDTDQADGTRQAVSHLLSLGHQTVWHVTGPEESFSAERRRRLGERCFTTPAAPFPRCVEATGQRSPATRPGCAWPTNRVARRCSPPTTRWRWVCCAPSTTGADPSPGTSASSVSTTFPRRDPSSRR